MLDVNIIGPVNENNYKSMQEYFLDMAYKVSYWKVGEEEKVESINTNQKMTTLTNLEVWTTYCLKVEPVLHNRKTHPSSIVCGTTMDNGRVPVWQVIVTLLASMCVVFGVTMGIFYSSHCIHRAVKHSFQPSYNLPEHIKEYLKEPSLTSQFLLPPPNLYEESFDKLSIISDIQQSFDNTNIDHEYKYGNGRETAVKEESPTTDDGEEVKGVQNSTNSNLYGRIQTLTDNVT